jgi:DNA-3-methyladenine glycosylase II
MESKKAYEQILKISKNKKFEILSDYLKNSKPVKINTTSLNFVPYLVSVVVSQQLSTKAAKTIWSRVMPLIAKSTQSKNFRENLRIAGLSGSKATYVIGLLENKELKKMQKEHLINMPPDEFQKLLLANKGIGPWSVQMARMFFLGEPDILPINDLGIKHAHEYLFSDHSMDENFYEQFSPWRTYLSLIMWNSID